jgi:selenocysteine lyase/cysteine desulfurase
MRKLGVSATARASFAVHNSSGDLQRLIDGLFEVRRVMQLD